MSNISDCCVQNVLNKTKNVFLIKRRFIFLSQKKFDKLEICMHHTCFDTTSRKVYAWQLAYIFSINDAVCYCVLFFFSLQFTQYGLVLFHCIMEVLFFVGTRWLYIIHEEDIFMLTRAEVRHEFQIKKLSLGWCWTRECVHYTN